MKKPLTILGIGLSVYLLIGVLIARYEVGILPPTIEPIAGSQYNDYSGALHIDSPQSISVKKANSLIAQAQEANLDFIFIDKLNSFSKQEPDQLHDTLLVFNSQKLSYLNSHIVFINKHPQQKFNNLRSAQVYLTDQFSSTRPTENDLTILAHPNKMGFQWTEQKSFPKHLEVFNLKSIWQEAFLKSKASFLWTLLIYPFNTELAIVRLFENAGSEEIKLLDKRNTLSPTFGVCGIHAKPKLWLGPLEFPSYKTIFSICKNHILIKGELTGNLKADRLKIYEAIENGQYYFSVDLLGNPKGFYAEITNKSGTYPIGSKLTLDDKTILKIHIPRKPTAPLKAVVYKNGARVFTSNSLDSEFHIHEEGNYRVVIRVIPTFPLPDGKKWIPWIYTNPFNLHL